MKKIAIFLLALGVLSCGSADKYGEKASQSSLADLEAGWANPPQAARTRVWWHWMNGNVTKDGIRKDLEWMARIGLGGVHNFDAALGTPTIVDKRLVYMDEGWQDAFAYAVGNCQEKIGFRNRNGGGGEYKDDAFTGIDYIRLG